MKFAFSMLWIQMSTASGGSSWCHGWLCMSEQGLGWLITAEGCRAGFSGGRCLESRGAFHISAISKNSFDVLPGLLWCSRSVWQTLPFSVLYKKNLLAHLPSVVDCTSPVRKSRLFQWDYGKSITGGLCFKDTSFLIMCLQYDLGGWPLG